MENPNAPLHDNPQYLQGRILALQAVVLALAQVMRADPAEFQAAGRQQLDRLRTALLPLPIAEAQLAAVDQMEAWLAQVTGEDPI